MRILFFTLFLTIYSFVLNAEIVNDVVINNNKRIAKESIISLGNIKFGNDYDQSDLDKVLKNLYGTNFFLTLIFLLRAIQWLFMLKKTKLFKQLK